MVTIALLPVDSTPVQLDTVKTVAMWSIIVIAVVGILAAIIIRKIIGKIISLVLAAALIFVGWQQRDKVTEYADQVKSSACVDGKNPDKGGVSFLGIDVHLPAGLCAKS